MKTLLALLCSLFFYSITFAQPGDLPPNPEPGKCYARCMIYAQPIEQIIEYPVYTGSNPEEVKLKTIEIVKKPATTEWVKKREGKGEKGLDEVIWCLVESTPAVTETLTIVKNTKKTKDYKMVSVVVREDADPKSYTEWREVLCNEKINKKTILQLQEALQLEGYYEGPLDGTFSPEVKTALTAFQKQNSLPIGNLDMESLNDLGIATTTYKKRPRNKKGSRK